MSFLVLSRDDVSSQYAWRNGHVIVVCILQFGDPTFITANPHDAWEYINIM